jgi:hypothetical protein
MIYKEIPDFDIQKVKADIQSGNVDSIIYGLLSTVLNSGDYQFSQELILNLCDHNHEHVRGNDNAFIWSFGTDTQND